MGIAAPPRQTTNLGDVPVAKPALVITESDVALTFAEFLFQLRANLTDSYFLNVVELPQHCISILAGKINDDSFDAASVHVFDDSGRRHFKKEHRAYTP